jgi:RNA polymerase sigma-70 factor (ECF subfamily)
MNPINRLLQQRALGHQLEERRQRLHRVARSWCRNRTLADDLVQETFTKALRSLDQLREPKAFDAWLFHILHNCWCDHCRRERPSEDIEDFADASELASEPPHESREVVKAVRAAVTRLPEPQRIVLTLVDLAGFSYAEVEMILEIPIGTVTSRISRAREALRDSLAAFVAEPSNVVPIRITGT